MASEPPAIFSPEFLADPFPTYAYLREHDPIHYIRAMNTWVLTRYEDVVAALKDRRLSSALRADEDAQSQIPNLLRFQSTAIAYADQPEHTRLRNFMHRSFSPAGVLALRDSIREIVQELLAAMEGKEEVDFIQDFSYPLPTAVIAELVGVPADERHLFSGWSRHIVDGFDVNATPEQQRQCNETFKVFGDYVLDLAHERRQRPRNDFLTKLTQPNEQGDQLTDEELAYNCLFLLIAGHETITSLLANGLVALLEHPEQLRQVQEDPSLLPAAVEEIARFARPLQMVPRMAREDMTLGGCNLKAGQPVAVLLASANHDPQVFTDPDEFDIRRTPNPHLAFGHGIHYCLGAPLARLESPIALEEFLRRFPQVQLAPKPLEHLVTLRNHTLTELPIRL